jgi:aminopeptidase N
MLKVLIGADAFRRGMDLYFERHDGQAATVEDFIACFADTSGRDLSQFMLWYVQSGTPEVGAAASYDAATRRLSIEFSQSLAPTPGQPVKTPMLIPVALALIGEDGKELPIHTKTPLSNGVLALSEPLQTVTFEDVDGPLVPSLLRGFSAPVKLTTNLEDSDLLFLAAHDTDPFGRWQAMQTYATRFLLRSVAAVRSGERLAPEDALLEAVGAAFADESLEPAFAAQLVALPSESDLARDLAANVDPDAVRTAREDLRRALSRELAPILERRWKQLAGGAYSPDAASAGRRALRNAAIDLRCAASDPDGLKLAAQQYERADNMTDRLAALAVLAVYDDAAREPTLADFYAKFEADPLVIDKWLGLQATIPEPTTIERVRNLMNHSAFSMSNPNRVRSLFGSFAVGNPTQFNRPDGAGFDLVCDVVLTLDARNPQVAARLLAAFKTWQVLEPGRRAKAEAALRRVAAKEGLSPDVGDIARRALEGLK